MAGTRNTWNFSFDKEPKNADEAKKLHQKMKNLWKRRFEARKKKLSIAKRRSQKIKSRERIGLMNNTSFNTVELMQCDGCYESFPVDKIISGYYHDYCEICELKSTISCSYCELPYDTTHFEDWYTPICRECAQDRIDEEKHWYRRRRRFRRKRRKRDLF